MMQLTQASCCGPLEIELRVRARARLREAVGRRDVVARVLAGRALLRGAVEDRLEDARVDPGARRAAGRRRRVAVDVGRVGRLRVQIGLDEVRVREVALSRRDDLPVVERRLEDAHEVRGATGQGGVHGGATLVVEGRVGAVEGDVDGVDREAREAGELAVGEERRGARGLRVVLAHQAADGVARVLAVADGEDGLDVRVAGRLEGEERVVPRREDDPELELGRQQRAVPLGVEGVKSRHDARLGLDTSRRDGHRKEGLGDGRGQGRRRGVADVDGLAARERVDEPQAVAVLVGCAAASGRLLREHGDALGRAAAAIAHERHDGRARRRVPHGDADGLRGRGRVAARPGGHGLDVDGAHGHGEGHRGLRVREPHVTRGRPGGEDRAPPVARAAGPDAEVHAGALRPGVHEPDAPVAGGGEDGRRAGGVRNGVRHVVQSRDGAARPQDEHQGPPGQPPAPAPDPQSTHEGQATSIRPARGRVRPTSTPTVHHVQRASSLACPADTEGSNEP